MAIESMNHNVELDTADPVYCVIRMLEVDLLTKCFHAKVSPEVEHLIFSALC